MALTVYTQDHEPREIADLRAEYGARTDNPVVKNITLIGARFSERVLSENDLNWLQCSLQCCKESDVAVSADFVLVPLDISHKGDEEVVYNEEEDFLTQTIPTDLLIAGFIYHPKCRSEIDTVHDTHPALRRSPKWRDRQAWPNAAARSGAKVIVAFWAEIDRDLTINDFHQPGFILRNPRETWMNGYPYSLQSMIREDIPFRPTRGFNSYTSRYHSENPG